MTKNIIFGTLLGLSLLLYVPFLQDTNPLDFYALEIGVLAGLTVVYTMID